jgi:hypothetical protein
MKRLIIGLIAICSTSLALAQTQPSRVADSNPVSFMGISVSGNLESFLLKVEEKGFKVSSEGTANMSMLNGDFLGEKADLLILSTEGTQQVYGVIVLLQKNNNWATMKGNFNILKKMYTEQYGKPEKNDHYFTKPFDDVQDEMQKVELGMCDYLCSWNTPNVILEITKSARIIITYENDAAFREYAGL